MIEALKAPNSCICSDIWLADSGSSSCSCSIPCCATGTYAPTLRPGITIISLFARAGSRSIGRPLSCSLTLSTYCLGSGSSS
jgi:hypothetical protein